jgi:hypothetical protein
MLYPTLIVICAFFFAFVGLFLTQAGNGSGLCFVAAILLMLLAMYVHRRQTRNSSISVTERIDV